MPNAQGEQKKPPNRLRLGGYTSNKDCGTDLNRLFHLLGREGVLPIKLPQLPGRTFEHSSHTHGGVALRLHEKGIFIIAWVFVFVKGGRWGISVEC